MLTLSKFKNGFERIRRPLSIILLVIGVALLLVQPVKQYLMKQYDSEVKTELRQLTPDSIKEAEAADATYDYDAVRSISLETILAAKQNQAKAPMIGEIAMPDVDMNLPIVKGVTDNNLLVGAATMKPNQKMGVGNYTLASHYSDAYNESLLFAPLIRAKEGMKIYLTDLENIYTYTVTSVTLVEPTAVEVLDETGENIITLVTCNDLSATKRRIVRGKLTNITPVKNADKNLTSYFESEFKTY